MPNTAMKHDKDPKQEILDLLGDVSGYQIEPHQILLAIYRRPEKTIGGIVLPRSNLQEDLYQSKAHLIIRMGKQVECSLPIKLHDWVVVRPSDGWDLEFHKVPCRMVFGDNIKAIIPEPGVVW